jgi:hypothetical protein
MLEVAEVLVLLQVEVVVLVEEVLDILVLVREEQELQIEVAAAEHLDKDLVALVDQELLLFLIRGKNYGTFRRNKQ